MDVSTVVYFMRHVKFGVYRSLRLLAYIAYVKAERNWTKFSRLLVTIYGHRLEDWAMSLLSA
jgi:hypothetical protein